MTRAIGKDEDWNPGDVAGAVATPLRIDADGLDRDLEATATIGIARLSAFTGVTPRTLRYYETKGILRSTRSRAGARLFTPHQCDIAVAVIHLRRLGVPLADIGPVLEVPGSARNKTLALRELLERRVIDLEHRLYEVRTSLSLPLVARPGAGSAGSAGDAPAGLGS